MRKYRHALSFAVFGMPLIAAAQVPVVEGDSGAAYGNSGYSTAAPESGGAYVGGGAAAPASAQGMLFQQLQQMQEEIAQLRGMLEEQQNQIQRLQQEGLERYQDLDRRLASGAAGSAASGQNSVADAGQSASGGSVAPNAPAPSGDPAGDPAKEKLYYDAAFDLIKAKDFDKASQAFGAFFAQVSEQSVCGQCPVLVGRG